MRTTSEIQERLTFLQRVVLKEIRHLEYSSSKVFATPMSAERAATLEEDELLAEQVEAFTSRFCRLQDTVGDKLLPQWLNALGERIGPAIDNLNTAEKLGMLESAQGWLETRQLRNQMIHEYIESSAVLADALTAAYLFQPVIIAFAERLLDDLERRGIIEPTPPVE